MDERLEVAPVGVVELSEAGVVTGVNARAGSLLEVDATAATGRPIQEVFPESVDDSVPAAFDGEFADPVAVEEYYPGPDRWLDVTVRETGGTVTMYLQDVSDRHHQRQRIERLRDDLDRVTITNEVISDILAALVDASTREEIAATIVDRLGGTGLAEFAWVGERELGGDAMVVSAAAGATGRTLTAIEDAVARGVEPPEQRAIETATPEIVQPLGEHRAVPESIRKAAFADGLQSLLAIPLRYGANVDGVVGIYSADLDAFSERERASFATVGEMAGFAINAARRRSLLRSDTVVELTVGITDPAAPLVVVSEQHGISLTVDGIVPRDNDLLCYVQVESASPTAVADALGAQDGIEDVRVIGEYDGGGSVEATVGEGTPLGILASRGGTIQYAEFTEGRGECVIELPPAEDVRRIAESITRPFESEILAKRERQREVTTAGEFRDELSAELTAKQENALRTAYFAEYFESPRGSTAEEVAAALDITGPTLLHHLRAGQRKLLGEFFETTEDRSV